MSTPFTKRRRKLVAEINVVPYIDVMLVLLIVFMISAPLITQGVKVDLPTAMADKIETAEDQQVIVSIKTDGSYYMDIAGDPETSRSLSEVQTVIKKVLQENPTMAVLVWGDKNVPYGEVIGLMSALQLSGVNAVGLVTRYPQSL